MKKILLLTFLIFSSTSFALTREELKLYDQIVILLGDKNPNRLKGNLKIYNNFELKGEPLYEISNELIIDKVNKSQKDFDFIIKREGKESLGEVNDNQYSFLLIENYRNGIAKLYTKDKRPLFVKLSKDSFESGHFHKFNRWRMIVGEEARGIVLDQIHASSDLDKFVKYISKCIEKENVECVKKYFSGNVSFETYRDMVVNDCHKEPNCPPGHSCKMEGGSHYALPKVRSQRLEVQKVHPWDILLKMVTVDKSLRYEIFTHEFNLFYPYYLVGEELVCGNKGHVNIAGAIFKPKNGKYAISFKMDTGEFKNEREQYIDDILEVNHELSSYDQVPVMLGLYSSERLRSPLEIYNNFELKGEPLYEISNEKIISYIKPTQKDFDFIVTRTEEYGNGEVKDNLYHFLLIESYKDGVAKIFTKDKRPLFVKLSKESFVSGRPHEFSRWRIIEGEEARKIIIKKLHGSSDLSEDIKKLKDCIKRKDMVCVEKYKTNYFLHEFNLPLAFYGILNRGSCEFVPIRCPDGFYCNDSHKIRYDYDKRDLPWDMLTKIINQDASLRYQVHTSEFTTDKKLLIIGEAPICNDKKWNANVVATIGNPENKKDVISLEMGLGNKDDDSYRKEILKHANEQMDFNRCKFLEEQKGLTRYQTCEGFF